MKRIYLIILFLPALIWGITLPQCLSAAEDNYAANPNQKIFWDMQTLNAQSLQSKWYPQLNLSANYTTKSESTTLDLGETPLDLTLPEQEKYYYDLSLSLQQMLYDGGIIRRNLELSELRTKSRVLEVKADLLQRRILVTSLYYQILLAQRQEEILALHKENLAAELRKVEVGISAGLLDKSRSLLIQDKLWQMAQETFKVKYQKSLCQEKLSSVTAMQITETDSLKDYQSELSMPLSLERPELENLELKRAIELTQAKLSGSGMLPQLKVHAAYAWGNPGYDIFSDTAHTYYRAGINFDWQIWDWQSRKKERIVHHKMAEAISNNKIVQEQNIKLTLIEKDNLINRLTENLKIQSQRKDLLNQVMISYEVKLTEGIISTEDYLQQFNNHKEIELQLSATELEISYQKILKLFIMGGKL